MMDDIFRRMIRPVDARSKMGIMSRGENIYRGGFNSPSNIRSNPNMANRKPGNIFRPSSVNQLHVINDQTSGRKPGAGMMPVNQLTVKSNLGEMILGSLRASRNNSGFRKSS